MKNVKSNFWGDKIISGMTNINRKKIGISILGTGVELN